MREEVLEGGNASGPVVRVGDTVRKAWTAATPHIVAYVRAMRDGGVDAPEPLGRDAQGRQIIEFIPGTLAMDAAPLSAAELGCVGDMVRRIHDVSARYVPAAEAIWEPPLSAPAQELICHNDLAPWNLMLGDRWVFIDWDGASPSTRSWDLAFSAQTFALPDPTRDPQRSADDLAAFVDGYGADAELRAVLGHDALAHAGDARPAALVRGGGARAVGDHVPHGSRGALGGGARLCHRASGCVAARPGVTASPVRFS
ncbi:phosphotransferase [Microbacterium paraoxydans]|uniref:phosphotransferase n=1 Tax=Microbacterium paraoxydans TaxID=199592 RepID=UPI0028D83BA1|nr:phosphotransferase [Microbacterium paraoxydans]